MEQIFIPGSSYGCNQCFYKRKNNFYNSTVQAISRGGGDCATKVGALCALFVDMGSPVKTQVEKWTEKDLWFTGTDHQYVWPRHFHLKGFRSSWWRRKENKHKRPYHRNPEAIRSFFVFHDGGPPRLGWPKLQAQSHGLQGLCSNPAICRWYICWY